MSSKMKKQDFQELYDRYVATGLQRWKQIVGEASDNFLFLLWASDLILDELELAEEQIIDACRLDGKWDLKIDSGYYDRQGQKMYLIQAKHWNPTKSIGDSPFFATWESLELLSNEKLVKKANKYTREFHVDFAEAVKDGSQIVLCVATSGKILQQQIDYIESKPKKRKIQVGDDWYEVPVTFRKFGLQDLIEIEKQGEIKAYVRDEPITLKLQQGWYLVPEKAEGKTQYDSLYTTIPAEEIVAIRNKIGPDLYRLNYRGPLGDRIAVNQAILVTIEGMPETFHVLNNGLTAICDYFRVDEKSKLVNITGLQIVNGCQTVETLFRHPEEVMGKKNIKVNLRLAVCERSQSALIAKATNTQTKLRAEDFATLDPIQDDLQNQFSKLTPEPWYYEIKRKYWNNVVSRDKSEEQKYMDELGEPRIIALRDAAQRSLAFLGEPITAAQNTAQIYREKKYGGYREDIYPGGLSAYQILLPWLIYKTVKGSVEEYLQGIPELDTRDKAREWLGYGKLTAVALVGDALRAFYKIGPMEYVDNQRSKKLVERCSQWSKPLIMHALDVIWNCAKSNKTWGPGPRAIFRKPQTYETDLRSAFIPSFNASKANLTLGLPS